MSYITIGENEYWLKDDLDNTGANYRIAYSQRGPGKSYQIKCQAIDNWLDGGKQFGLIRRLDKNLSIDKVSEYWDDMTEYFYEKASLVFPAYDQFFISPKSGKWTVYGLVTASGRKDKLGVIGYYFSCSCADNYKSSGSYPDIVFDVYEEFMSNTHQYLPNEFDALMSIISTTKRRKKDFVVYMLGNTVDMNCPLLTDMKINVRDIAPGDIKMFTYYGGQNGETKNTVAVEYIRPVKQSEESESFFIFNRQQENMIINGAWQTEDYPKFLEDEFYSTVRPKLSLVMDYKDIKLFCYFDYDKKTKLPILYISDKRLGNRFKYIFITSKTNISRNQYSYTSDLPIINNIKRLINICMNNNSVLYLNNYSGADFDTILKVMY